MVHDPVGGIVFYELPDPPAGGRLKYSLEVRVNTQTETLVASVTPEGMATVTSDEFLWANTEWTDPQFAILRIPLQRRTAACTTTFLSR